MLEGSTLGRDISAKSPHMTQERTRVTDDLLFQFLQLSRNHQALDVRAKVRIASYRASMIEGLKYGCGIL